MLKIFKRFSTYTLIVALIISAISAYYSILGLMSIFSAAVLSIAVMGVALEAGKLVAAVWLKINWRRAPIIYKLYLVPAVAFLMMLTSMGIFGYLSKAHSDQTLLTGDVGAQIAIFDEKIKIQRENITNAQSVIKQMDATVQGIIEKGESREIKLRDGSTYVRSPAELALNARRSQAKDRDRLTGEIERAQAEIIKLQEESAPIRANVRQVEAKVGPIKYIAALIYGDNHDNELLERAVRWVIILIVIVFDPLALVLILAAQQSMRWEREEEGITSNSTVSSNDDTDSDRSVDEFFARHRELAKKLDKDAETEVESTTEKKSTVEHAYLKTGFTHFGNIKPMVATPQSTEQESTVEVPTPVEPTADAEQTVDTVENTNPNIETVGVTSAIAMYPSNAEYVNFEGKSTSIAALRNMRPDLIYDAKNPPTNAITWGREFPKNALTGDMYTRVDTVPHRVFKFNGVKWIELNRAISTTYLQNEEYVQFLIQKLETGEYDSNLLTEAEEEEIKQNLSK